MTFAADLPMPPSSNNMFVNAPGKQGGRFPSGAYKAWEKEAARALLDQWEAANRPQIAKPYAVHIRVNLNHQGDIANREKAITDLLVSTIPGFPGDQWANLMVIERDRTVEAARVEVVSLA